MKQYIMVVLSLFSIGGCSQISEPVVEKSNPIEKKLVTKKNVEVSKKSSLTNQSKTLNFKNSKVQVPTSMVKKRPLPSHIKNSHIQSVERY